MLAITYILPSFFAGVIIVAAIAGSWDIAGLGALLLVADILLGCYLQYKKETMTRDIMLGYAIGAASEITREENNALEDLGEMELLIKLFDTIHELILGDGGKCPIQSFTDDPVGKLLVGVCHTLSHKPPYHTVANPKGAIASRVGSCKAIIYCYNYKIDSVCENAYIHLVRTGEGIRLFTTETDCGKLFLCEYKGDRHLNYGTVTPREIGDKIAGIIAR